MSRVVRFAESVLVAVVPVGDTLTLHFAPLYALQSEGIPGVNATALWTHTSELSLGEAEAEAAPDLPATILTAEVRDPPHVYREHLPLPYKSRGAIRFSFTLVGGGQWTITARTAELKHLSGRYVQHLDV